MELDDVRTGFVAAGLPVNLVDELLDTYSEAKRRFHLGDLRPQEVEGGRFSEAAFRVLQHVCGKQVTPLGKQLPSVDTLVRQLENETSQPDAIRFHVPRTLRLIYDVRNKRDVAHLGDQIDPNLQDATLVVANMDWTVAELVRLFHDVSADEAQAIIENAGAAGASLDELAGWLRTRKDHLRDRLAKLDADKLVLLHPRTGRYFITGNGRRDVETRDLARPA